MLTLTELKSIVSHERSLGREKLIVPMCRRLSADLLTPVSAFLVLRAQNEFAFLLESVEGGEKLARYSFLGRRPYKIIRSETGRVTVQEGTHNPDVREGSIFGVLKSEIAEWHEVNRPDVPRLSSGAVGYLAYDAVRTLENLPDAPSDDMNLPDAIWAFYDTIAAFDHVKHQLVLISSVFVDQEADQDTDLERALSQAEERIIDLQNDLYFDSLPHSEPVSLKGEARSNVGRERFIDAVNTAKKYIVEGDIFQVVLSQRFEIPFEGDAFTLYRSLRQVNPSPYLYFLDFGDFQLVGSSPEVLVRVEDMRAELLPIAGTRPRGSTTEEDVAYEKDLLADPKERAEHVMLVDLGRNDLSRVCTSGTVSVDRYAYVERYSHVMHIVSSVSGKLDEAHDSIDVLAACFPAGTVSGAPKVRAMEIIDELEPSKRSTYAGAVGYINFSGSLDTCITIRTMLIRNNRIYIQAGAGIVADSIPDNEFEETKSKARALTTAIEIASRELLDTRRKTS